MTLQLLKIGPAFCFNLFKTSALLRQEESVSSVADASCLSMTVYSGLLQTKSISTSIGAKQQKLFPFSLLQGA